MKPENTPPPTPEMKDSTRNHQYGVEVSCTAKNHPSIGMMKRKEDSVTSLRVPTMAGRNMNTSRNSPQDRPAMDVSQ